MSVRQATCLSVLSSRYSTRLSRSQQWRGQRTSRPCCARDGVGIETYGRRAFSVAGPTARNSLPDFIRAPTSSTDCFRRLLKTYLSYCFVSSGRLHSIWHRRVVLLGSAESTTLSLAARYQWLPRRRRISATADGAAAEPGRRDVIALRHHYL